MKRLFSRRDKDKPPQIAPGLSLTPTTAPISREDESQSTPTSKINGFLAPSAPGMSRRKSSFFLSVLSPSKNMNPSSQSGSDNGSAPLTSRSISGSSDTSSSYMSTPTDEQITPYASETGANTKPWQSWMGSMSKAKSRQSGAPPSSFSNVSRPTVPATVSLARVSIADESSEDEKSEESTASSWEQIRPEDVVGNTKSRGRRVIRSPGDSGRRQLTPHSKQAQARSVFGGRTVAAPISKQTSKALANLQALTIDALVPPTCAPPLVQTSSSVPFPRSANRIQTIHNSFVGTSYRQHSPLHTEILRKRLLRRIELRVLTEPEQESIQLLATRPPRPRNVDRRKLPAAEETYEDSKAVGGGWSKGMKRWAMRPCFEERVVVWKPHAAGLSIAPVQRDARCSVAALEFSEGAEALAGLHRQNELPPPPSDIYVPASNRKLPPPLVIPRSPNGMNKSLHPSLGPSSSRGGLPSSRLRIDSAMLSGQDEDDLPLGVVMIQRRQKEEAEERKRREKLERERKAREEEERKKQYSEQLAAARARREIERMGKPGATKDAWLEGDPDALPPPPKPYAHPIRSNSNPNLTSSPSSATLQVNRPVKERRMTSESSVASVHSGTTITSKRQDVSRQQSAPPVPSPWSALPSGPPSNSNARQNSSTTPRSAPPTQMNYGMMGMPVIPDPLSLAMFEQGFHRPWMMGPMNGSLNGGSTNGTLTPPRPLFTLGSSGDSSGSLTPPRFPDSRPPSWGSSNEDVRMAMRRVNSTGSGGSVPRPISGISNAHSSGGSAEDWRVSRSSMLISTADDQRNNRSQSRSPTDPPLAGNTGSLGHSRLNSGMTRSMRSESSMVPPQQQAQQSQSERPSSAGSQQRSQSQSRSRTHPPSPPPPLPTAASGSLKGAYGLPTLESYNSSSSLGRKSMLSASRSTEGVPVSGSSGSVNKMTGGASGQGRPRMHVHSKSSGPPASQRTSRLW